jgi:autotransporter passenger strand-loop-strand repeat protein
VDSGGFASTTTLDAGGFEIVSAAGNDFGAQISSGGEQVIFGIAIGANVNSEGTQIVETGGLASSTTVNAGENLTLRTVQTVEQGGTATDTSVSGGYSFQNVYGTAFHTTLNFNGTQFVFAGGTALAALVTGQSTEQEIEEGGSGSDTVVESGGLEHTLGTAFGTTINSGGTQLAEGLDSGVIINASGQQIVHATAIDTTVNSAAVQTVEFGGKAYNAVVTGDGRQDVYSNSLASDTTAEWRQSECRIWRNS